MNPIVKQLMIELKKISGDKEEDSVGFAYKETDEGCEFYEIYFRREKYPFALKAGEKFFETLWPIHKPSLELWIEKIKSGEIKPFTCDCPEWGKTRHLAYCASCTKHPEYECTCYQRDIINTIVNEKEQNDLL